MLTINNTLDGYLKDVEIKGNTIQDTSNLADIRSVGDKIEGQELYEIPVLSCGKNLLNINTLARRSYIQSSNGDVTPVGDNTNPATSEFIKVNPNSSYIISFENPRGVFFGEYDCNRKFIKKSSQVSKLITSENTRYIRVQIGFATSDEVQNIQIEEGTVATPYEPYQKDKLTILSPVKLEKVRDVRDKIICKDGVWGVEKNTIRKSLTASSVAHNGTVNGLTEYIIDTLENSDTTITSNVICNKLVNKISATEEGCFVTKNQFRVRVLTNTYPNAESIKNEVINNKWYIIYKSAQPQFIPLPHDQQVKLRTFANKTNISFGCEIEGTIKAQVPKSLGATVNTHTTQISNLNKELDRVKKLEESTVSTVTTESDFTTVEATSNGYFEDVKLEGKTLVNIQKTSSGLYPDFSSTNTLVQGSTSKSYYYKVEIGKTYTFIKSPSDRYIAGCCNSVGAGASITKVNTTVNDATKTMIDKFVASGNYFFVYGSSTNTDFNTILLEGDHTQNPPSYFEGLMSVGEDVDEIVVSSVKGDGNLFDGELELGSINNTSGLNEVSTNCLRSKNYIRVQGGKTITLSNDMNYANYIYEYRKDFTLIKLTSKGTTNTITTDINTCYVRFRSIVSATQNNVNVKYILNYGDSTSYKEYITDKKRLLFYNEETQTWEKPVLREWDSIEKHGDGKYYYHQRSGEVVLNGSENWSLAGTPNQANSKVFSVICNGMTSLHFDKATVIADKFKTVNTTSEYNLDDSEYMCCSGSKIYTRILNTKLSTQDVAGFKQWLQTNNVTVVYQLAEEKVYECTNIDLITYTNETNYIVESGAIVPKSILKVHNNISNVVSLLQKKVSLLESNITKYMITQNRMQLASTYSADSVTFKVDYALCSEETEEYNEDLYNLILNNILVGKDNYDYDKMFTMILDYASWNQISWEQFDILVGLMDMQHNPPVEDEVIEETPNEIM